MTQCKKNVKKHSGSNIIIHSSTELNIPNKDSKARKCHAYMVKGQSWVQLKDPNLLLVWWP